MLKKHNKTSSHGVAQCISLAIVSLIFSGTVFAQVVEDHSLPKSHIKTYHVKCSSGRMAMIRFDVRTDPTNMCVSVQDGSRPQSCVKVNKEQAPKHINTLARWVCE